MPKKGGLGQLTDLRGQLGKKEVGGVFEAGVDTPMHTIIHRKTPVLESLCRPSGLQFINK